MITIEEWIIESLFHRLVVVKIHRTPNENNINGNESSNSDLQDKQGLGFLHIPHSHNSTDTQQLEVQSPTLANSNDGFLWQPFSWQPLNPIVVRHEMKIVRVGNLLQLKRTQQIPTNRYDSGNKDLHKESELVSQSNQNYAKPSEISTQTDLHWFLPASVHHITTNRLKSSSKSFDERSTSDKENSLNTYLLNSNLLKPNATTGLQTFHDKLSNISTVQSTNDIFNGLECNDSIIYEKDLPSNCKSSYSNTQPNNVDSETNLKYQLNDLINSSNLINRNLKESNNIQPQKNNELVYDLTDTNEIYITHLQNKQPLIFNDMEDLSYDNSLANHIISKQYPIATDEQNIDISVNQKWISDSNYINSEDDDEGRLVGGYSRYVLSDKDINSLNSGEHISNILQHHDIFDDKEHLNSYAEEFKQNNCATTYRDSVQNENKSFNNVSSPDDTLLILPSSSDLNQVPNLHMSHDSNGSFDQVIFKTQNESLREFYETDISMQSSASSLLKQYPSMNQQFALHNISHSIEHSKSQISNNSHNNVNIQESNDTNLNMRNSTPESGLIGVLKPEERIDFVVSRVDCSNLFNIRFNKIEGSSQESLRHLRQSSHTKRRNGSLHRKKRVRSSNILKQLASSCVDIDHFRDSIDIRSVEGIVSPRRALYKESSLEVSPISSSIGTPPHSFLSTSLSPSLFSNQSDCSLIFAEQSEQSILNYVNALNMPLLEHLQMCDWMAKLPTKYKMCKISSITMPGSHISLAIDSDMRLDLPFSQCNYELSTFLNRLPDLPAFNSFRLQMKYIWRVWMPKQAYSIYDQLCAGSRYLEFHVACSEDGYTRGEHGLYTDILKTYLKQIRLFIEEHRLEVVILHFSRISNANLYEKKTIVTILFQIFGSRAACYHHNASLPSLHDMQTSGKQLIIFFEQSDFTDIAMHIFARIIWPDSLIKIVGEKCQNVDLLTQKMSFHYDQDITKRREDELCVLKAYVSADMSTVFGSFKQQTSRIRHIEHNNQAILHWISRKFNCKQLQIIDYSNFDQLYVLDDSNLEQSQVGNNLDCLDIKTGDCRLNIVSIDFVGVTPLAATIIQLNQ